MQTPAILSHRLWPRCVSARQVNRMTRSRYCTSNGKRVAVVVPVEDADLWIRLEEEQDIKDAYQALARIKAGRGTVSLEDVKTRLGP